MFVKFIYGDYEETSDVQIISKRLVHKYDFIETKNVKSFLSEYHGILVGIDSKLVRETGVPEWYYDFWMENKRTPSATETDMRDDYKKLIESDISSIEILKCDYLMKQKAKLLKFFEIPEDFDDIVGIKLMLGRMSPLYFDVEQGNQIYDEILTAMTNGDKIYTLDILNQGGQRQ